jgi:hypothetical protein
MADGDLNASLEAIADELAMIRDAILVLALFESGDQPSSDAARRRLATIREQALW